MMSEFDFKNGTRWKMSYEEYKKCYCPECKRKNCPHREAFRRVTEEYESQRKVSENYG